MAKGRLIPNPSLAASLGARSPTALLLLVASACLGCSEEGAEQQIIRPVRALQIGDAPAFTGRTFPGTTAAVNAVDLSFRVSGPLVAFPGNELGKRVKKGDLLAQIDPRDFEIQRRDAQAALEKARSELDAMRKARPEEIEQMKAEVDRAIASAEYAKAEYDRNAILVQTKAVTPSELELSQAKLKLAEAEVVQAKEALRIGEEGARPEDIRGKQSQIDSLAAAVQKAQDALQDAKLLAPFDGSISAAYVDNFEVVQAKQPVVRMVNASELEVKVDVPENLIALASRVTEAVVTFPAFPGVEVSARLTEIGAEPAATTRTYPVKVRFTPPAGLDVRAGMTANVRARGEDAIEPASPGHVLPATAVFDRQDKRLVWIYDAKAQVVRARPVTVLGTTPFGVNVTGVEPGEWVVTAGVHYLEENQPVRLQGAKEDAQI